MNFRVTVAAAANVAITPGSTAPPGMRPSTTTIVIRAVGIMLLFSLLSLRAQRSNLARISCECAVEIASLRSQ